jgi:hypothetical protein
MFRLANPALPAATTSTAVGAGLLQRLRRHVGRTAAAMAGQARIASLRPETLRDTGLAPDDLADAPSHDPALPFFMQANFGCRDL